MTQLQFDSRDGRYHGSWSDGRQFSVDADVVAETRQHEERDTGRVLHEGGEWSRASNWSDDMDGVEVE